METVTAFAAIVLAGGAIGITGALLRLPAVLVMILGAAAGALIMGLTL